MRFRSIAFNSIYLRQSRANDRLADKHNANGISFENRLIIGIVSIFLIRFRLKLERNALYA